MSTEADLRQNRPRASRRRGSAALGISRVPHQAADLHHAPTRTGQGDVPITEEHQEILFDARPEAFEPLHWGKITRCMVNLKKVPKKELEALVREAWEQASAAAQEGAQAQHRAQRRLRGA